MFTQISYKYLLYSMRYIFLFTTMWCLTFFFLWFIVSQWPMLYNCCHEAYVLEILFFVNCHLRLLSFKFWLVFLSLSYFFFAILHCLILSCLSGKKMKMKGRENFSSFHALVISPFFFIFKIFFQVSLLVIGNKEKMQN